MIILHPLLHDDYLLLAAKLIALIESLSPQVEDVGDGKATIGFGYTLERNDNVQIWGLR